MQPLLPKNVPQTAANSAASGARGVSAFIPLGSVLRASGTKIDSAGSSGGGSGSCSGKKVETVEEDGVVKRILVICSCGEVTQIDCVYDA